MGRKKSRSSNNTKKTEQAAKPLKLAEFGLRVGDFLPTDIIPRFRWYKNYDLYVEHINADPAEFRNVSRMARVKEALQKIDHEEIAGGLILEKFDHPTEESTTMRILVHNGVIAAATISKSILEKYLSEQQQQAD